jgi:radical SAM superfamily enzyme YgiQ (UPF0313 family)
VNFLLVYPRWPKLAHQTVFNLPPHGPVVMAAAIPQWVTVTFVDDNVQDVPFDKTWDFVGISVMLTAQLPRAFEISGRFRARGTPVIFGGISAMLHAPEVQSNTDSLFFGEAEGRLARVFEDRKNGRLKPLYDYRNSFAPIEDVGPARRSILDYSRYEHKGVRMVDLFHASRGCKFNCYPCCTPFLGGRQFRPRPMERVAEELATIDNERLFVVDNSLAQDKQWELTLFRTMAPFKKSFCCHPIEDDDEVLAAAVDAGAWYVYQAIFDTSDFIRERIRRYKSFGLGVEGTIILGLDDHDEDSIKRLVEFLLEINLDLAEFTILTPFAHTAAREQMEKEGRITTNDFSKYNAGEVVYKPAKIGAAKLQELYHWAWETFYAGEPQMLKMARLYKKVLRKGLKEEKINRGATEDVVE